ncbi:DUF636 domain protein [Ramaria rubella]|nr:DUF636 domain protein [Ramaria rubella]
MTSNPRTLDGNCLCGNITYTIDDVKDEPAGICHCLDCRRSSGAAYSLVLTVPRSNVTLKGEYKEYITEGSVSGKGTHRVFCPNCGSGVVTFPEGDKTIAFIKAGTLSDEVQKTLKPVVEESYSFDTIHMTI